MAQDGLTFRGRIFELMYGDPEKGRDVDDASFVAQLRQKLERAVDLSKENTELKARLGVVDVENEQLKAKISHMQSQNPGYDVATVASRALSQMAAAYGEDLAWDNVVERTVGALSRLQGVVPILKDAQEQIGAMSRRLKEYEDREKVSGDTTEYWADVEGRLSALERERCMRSGSFVFLRKFASGRIGKKALGLLGMDSYFEKG